VELAVDEINYIESDGNYLLFHTDKKAYKSRSTIKQILEELCGNTFVQVHRAYVVNKTKIEKFNLKSLVISNTEIPISKYYINNFL
jgi:DNA-binding LytR/AlgR family response regulator